MPLSRQIQSRQSTLKGRPAHPHTAGSRWPALRWESPLWRRTLDEFPEAVLFVRAGDGKILVANSAAKDLLGVDVRGRRVADMGVEFRSPSGTPFASEEHPLLAPVLAAAPARETRLLLADGRQIDVTINVGPVHDEHAELVGVFAVLHDVTDRRALEQRREDFVWVAGHELRTPLASLKGWTQYAQRRLTRGESDDPARLLTTLSRQIARMEMLVEQLLDSAQLQQPRVDLEESEFDLVASIGALIQTLPPEWASRVIFRRSRAIRIRGDQGRLERVTLNILSNALKYSSPEGPVRVTLRSAGGQLLVAVRDWGIGIPSADVSHVFERFYRSSNSPHGGLGLGLYIAREIIERHGGHLTVRSIEGRGTTFAFTLPTGSARLRTATSPTASRVAGSTQ